MRSVLFVVFFSLGISLMILSGYVPKSASARGNSDEPVADELAAVELDDWRNGHRPLRPLSANAAGSPGHRYSSSTSGGSEDESGEVYTAEPEAVADVGVENSYSNHYDNSPEGVAGPVVDTSPGDEVSPAVGEEESYEWPLPIADAGADRVLWVGWNEITLDGSTSSGDGLTYGWKQVAGPIPLAIGNSAAATSTASGMMTDNQLTWSGAVYEFELTVTDEHGGQDVDYVQFGVRAAPRVVVRPSANRRFELRDGYMLGHVESWATNYETYDYTFEIKSRTELAFTKVAGGNYELSGGKLGNAYAYEVTVFGESGDFSSWLEFLVDTDEKIPGIIQLGVVWEEQ